MVVDRVVYFDDHRLEPYAAGEVTTPNARARVRLYRSNADAPIVALISDVKHLAAAWPVDHRPILFAIARDLSVDPDTTMVVMLGQGDKCSRYHDGSCGIRPVEISRGRVEQLIGGPLPAPEPSSSLGPIRLTLIPLMDDSSKPSRIIAVPFRTTPRGRCWTNVHFGEEVEPGSVVTPHRWVSSLTPSPSGSLPAFMRRYVGRPGESLEGLDAFILPDGRPAWLYGCRAEIIQEQPLPV